MVLYCIYQCVDAYVLYKVNPDLLIILLLQIWPGWPTDWHKVSNLTRLIKTLQQTFNRILLWIVWSVRRVHKICIYTLAKWCWRKRKAEKNVNMLTFQNLVFILIKIAHTYPPGGKEDPCLTFFWILKKWIATQYTLVQAISQARYI